MEVVASYFNHQANVMEGATAISYQLILGIY
jgi:hypothetical protein